MNKFYFLLTTLINLEHLLHSLIKLIANLALFCWPRKEHKLPRECSRDRVSTGKSPSQVVFPVKIAAQVAPTPPPPPVAQSTVRHR